MKLLQTAGQQTVLKIIIINRYKQGLITLVNFRLSALTQQNHRPGFCSHKALCSGFHIYPVTAGMFPTVVGLI